MKIYRFISVAWVAGSLLMFLAGCAANAPTKTPPLAEERKPLLLQAPLTTEGSLWLTRTNVNYFADVKARNVGDIVTINVVESASASKNAATKTSRASDLSASWAGVLAKMTGGWVGSDQSVNFANNFDGQGATTRSSTLNTYITATVIHVFPNGNLAIQGTRQVQVNNENQYINIQGVIRPTDISANNIVLSTFISDAKIELSGQGAVSDKQKPGWLARILDWVWPF
jgi:flagellar L-ring protein FlgH